MTFNAKFLDARQHEVQRKSHFKISIEGIDEEIALHVRSANLLEKQFDVIATRFFNDLVKQAGARTFSDLSLELHDAIGPDVERAIHTWQEQIQDSVTGYMGYAEDYKRSAKVTEYSINGDVRSVWQYEGVWPSSVNYGGMDREDVTKKTVSVTLSYDRGRLLSTSEQ
jgi:hypothetical protein